jgi:hypothetical protein
MNRPYSSQIGARVLFGGSLYDKSESSRCENGQLSADVVTPKGWVVVPFGIHRINGWD